MARFFVNRPIVAMVLSIIIVLLGVVAMRGLPIAQYPEIVPPMIQVTTTFIGASATDVEASVATPLEQQVNGVEKGIYMKSTNANDGTLTLKVSFEVGSNQDMDNVLTQNRVSQAMPLMPQSVKNYGVTVKKALAFPLLIISIKSPKGTYDNNFLSNYTTININDPIARIPGVGQINLFGGSDYAMRVWLRPDRISRLGLTIPDIANAIGAQNQLTPAGQIGGPPAATGTEFTYTVRTQGRLLNEQEFGDIILRTNPDGSEVRLKDVARLELGTMLYNAVGRHDGKPAAVIAVFQIPGTNAVQVASAIKAQMAELSKRFPRDMEYLISLDTTLPVTEGIKEIVHTLFEAVVLVIIVVFVFLQNWRATLIPLLTVPVSLVGAFIFFPLLGFSINVLSLLGLVLAIVIVVDDAIVVVEAVMHHIEHGMTPKEATVKAMEEVSGPVIAIGLILSAVFVPVGFMGGITGRLYQQFAITIAISVLLSVINALTLSPALSALLLKPATGKKTLLSPFYNWFNRVFGRTTDAYVSFAGILIRKMFRSLAFVGLLVFVIVVLMRHIPGGFVPEEDQGYIMVNTQLPDAASLERTDAVMRKAEMVLENQEAVEGFNTVSGYSLLTSAYSSNMGFFFVQLKPWEERHGEALHARAVIDTLNREFRREIPEAGVVAFGPPAIPGLGTGAGFTLELQDRSGGTPAYLAQQAQRFMEAARKRPEIGRVSTLYRASVPQIYVDIDRSKVLKEGVQLNDLNTTLGALLGSSYINDFNRFGRVYKVYLQAEPEFRRDPSQLGLFYVRNKESQMVPLDTLLATRPSAGPEFTNRFNLFRAAELTGVPAPGYSSAQALTALEETARDVLPPDMSYDWADMSYQEKKAPGVAVVFGLAVFLVFLILAAQYESWGLPFSVLLGTPFAAFGAYLGLWLARTYVSESYVNNVFAQIGLIMLIGLAAKNAILIVEFAKMEHEQGKPLVDAALNAAKLRLRPILMT
ncbi:MAG TPA: efflux RND transporter permease subunit, partial [Vicinamibacterales bacterium]|nr:efflux RND transporter permease subunit [Vicinamibacterales bacterium]